MTVTKCRFNPSLVHRAALSGWVRVHLTTVEQKKTRQESPRGFVDSVRTL
jgi:hypothetical protein